MTVPAGRDRKREEGFTLLEILVVVAIIGVLASFVAPAVMSRIGDARQVAARSQLEMIATALETYRLDVGRYPTTAQGLEALWKKPTLPPVPDNWRGPYLTKPVPADPWGNPYQYRFPGEKNPGGYDLASLGADGRAGGEAENADLHNW